MSDLLTPSRVRAAERIGFGTYVLIAVLLVGRQLGGNLASGATPAPSPPAATTTLPTVRPSIAAPAITATPSATVTAAPSPSPQPTLGPLAVTGYQNGGRRFAALLVSVGETLTSPMSGTVSVVVYQFLGGDVRIGSNIPSEPFYPYITITSPERKVTLRPGALNRDVQLIVKNGEAVAIGSPLFRTVSEGASSWRTFYDRSVTAQVIASFSVWPSGAELDPIPLFK